MISNENSISLKEAIQVKIKVAFFGLSSSEVVNGALTALSYNELGKSY